MRAKRETIWWIIILAGVLLLFVLCGRQVIGANEPINVDTKTHRVMTPITIDFGGVTVLGLPWPVQSVFGRTGDVVAQPNDYSFAQIGSKPTTLAGYGITDAQPLDSDLTAIAALSTTAFGRGGLTQADAPGFRSYIGAGTGNGSVTSVSSGNLSPLFNVGVTNSTTTPAFSFTPLQAAPNSVYSNRIGSAAMPDFGQLAFSNLAGAAATAQGGLPTGGTAGQQLLKNSATNYDASWGTPPGGGTVTSFTAGNLSPLFTTSVSNPSTTPALSFALSTAGANTFLGNATGSTAAPGFVQPNFTNLAGAASTAQGGVPTGGTAGQTLIKNSATNYDAGWVSAPGTNSVGFALTAGTTTGTGSLMMGAGAAGLRLTPRRSGLVLIIIVGSFSNDTAGSFNQFRFRYGTGTAPAYRAAATGSLGGANVGIHDFGANQWQNPSHCALIGGLTIGTDYWFDIAVQASSGICTIQSPLMQVIEL